MQKIIFLFIDGFGKSLCPEKNNPVSSLSFPELFNLVYDKSISIDAVMEVPGLPQSATGQTSILCGVNAQKEIGRHFPGFPGPALKKIIEEKNVYLQLKERGLSGTFANGYLCSTLREVSIRLERHMSATTIAALSGLGQVRLIRDLQTGNAVYQDITNEIASQKGFPVPVISPTLAAQNLIRIAERHHLTLFEYFQTDLAGHQQDSIAAARVLQNLETYLVHLMYPGLPTDTTLVLTSDHGNLEDLSIAQHTQNPVPFFACGPGREFLYSRVRNLANIVPAMIDWLTIKQLN
ncbi:MAG: hypothetical protein A2268_05325 [Candidatus Raymondbacteria bacterium RifOxyA12_full_50_37]|uniref:Metalloenzyme domain-containing protein n=1 Tax=Candidatus Raymondbacteria bacterium RIFOXYD12_FULL_49_13 TaxID=1817890 RepID=A0A1F7FBL7_UNCRA|nr:MAG: hypothetical protein A2268_05325 [Candidatus Raymondbacteria bacterium RifOxyA12_full_50_37]OGJ88985.1 MAG: hypothetical protein A2248_02560 [Candidatus Raymondbacteria bacterium RIFOXYA2_FULL_49_16]OGJ92494.1 MAG: hypothetical protein A2350_15705 [Candidatus Raymondbacteria bacterium RifOxyB12_full_50_8]OGJ97013.1 MAG: hypothetical protein A2453_03980 [Candidatus Raymondbacteria bacterium RIFOXYC2_FULL_50_21]OGK02557.1 MAG: hypothetical protein A2487_15050 [Candidatus Raymondbacteria b